MVLTGCWGEWCTQGPLILLAVLGKVESIKIHGKEFGCTNGHTHTHRHTNTHTNTNSHTHTNTNTYTHSKPHTLKNMNIIT